jgi:hypothetical protein
MTDLIERLLAVEGRDGPGSTHWYRNPDGPEAAAEIERQAARIAELEAVLRAAATDLENYAAPDAYFDNFGDPLPADAESHPGLLAAEIRDRISAALSPGVPT